MDAVVVCPMCGGTIEDHWQVFAHATCQSPPSAKQLAWREQKEVNRLTRKAERVFGLPWREIWRRYGAAVASHGVPRLTSTPGV